MTKEQFNALVSLINNLIDYKNKGDSETLHWLIQAEKKAKELLITEEKK